MSLQTRTKALVGNVVGYGFLLFALVAAGYGVYMVGLFAFAGLSAEAVVGAMFAFGLVLFCLVMGVYVRKAVAGTVLPLDVDTDNWRLTMFRGGQGSVDHIVSHPIQFSRRGICVSCAWIGLGQMGQ